MIHIFLINPSIENEPYLSSLKEQLTKREDIRYFIFNIREDASEETVVKRILKYVNDDVLRFYVVGGRQSLHRVLNALDGSFDRVELAWVPLEKSNSFINNFDTDTNLFSDIDAQINGQAQPIDYIRTNHGLAIDSITCGLDTTMMKLMDRVTNFPSLSRSVHIAILRLYTFFGTSPINCGFQVDGTSYYPVSPKMQFFLSNGGISSNSQSKASYLSINDGIGEFIIDYDFKSLSKLKRELFPSKKGTSQATYAQTGSFKSLRLITEESINLSMDGILYEGLTELESRIVSNQLKFVIPT